MVATALITPPLLPRLWGYHTHLLIRMPTTVLTTPPLLPCPKGYHTHLLVKMSTTALNMPPLLPRPQRYRTPTGKNVYHSADHAPSVSPPLGITYTTRMAVIALTTPPLLPRPPGYHIHLPVRMSTIELTTSSSVATSDDHTYTYQ